MNIPNSFSVEDLLDAMKKAPQEETIQAEKTETDEEYQKRIVKIANRILSDAFTELPDPVMHKTIAVMVIQNLCSYHEKRAVNALENENPQVAGLWARDCGQLMAALQVLQTTSVGEQDFMAKE